MTEDEIVSFVGALPGVVVVRASEANGAPQVAWGDTFFFFDPDGDKAAHERHPFVTIVTNDYPGFDTESDLSRPDVFRVNVAVGRERYESLFGHPASGHTEHRDGYDFASLDTLVPHPVYWSQGWVCVVSPGESTSGQVRLLATEAYALAVARHDRRSARGSSGG